MASTNAYDEKRKAAAKKSADDSREGRDIGPLPEVVDKERRDSCKNDLKLFCETYFPETFSMNWSKDHLKVIKKIENSVLKGGLFCIAMPRGSGKTSICEIACIWATIYGHRLFVVIIGADGPHASNMLESIKTEFENNDLLLEDFPEACFPIKKLEGIVHRSRGQLLNGENTNIKWTNEEIHLPTVPNSVCSGGIIKSAGLTGSIRGMKIKRKTDTRPVRPDLVLVDDPQTDDSARSPSQCKTRERILSGAVLGLAGPGKKIAGLMAVTVVREGDMADNLLDREKHPRWQGERTKMVYKFPENEDLWEEYNKIREDGLKDGTGTEAATEFYKEHRAEMDLGAEVAWPERYDPGQISAIQNAMDLKFDDEIAFYSEYQNTPMPEDDGSTPLLSSDFICSKLNKIERGVVSQETSKVVSFTDIHADVLYWVVAGWSPDFGGQVIDYGTWPKQRQSYFLKRSAKYTLEKMYPGYSLEARVYAGLEAVGENVAARMWNTQNGGTQMISRWLIDANWNEAADPVYNYCKQGPFANIAMPSHGRFYGASSIPMSETRRQRGDRLGANWKIPGNLGQRTIKRMIFDTNYWKSYVHSRLAVPMGDKSCLTLFGSKRETHRMFSEHLVSESKVPTEAKGRKVDEWKTSVGEVDNHFFDCLVGCAVAASEQGISGIGHSRKRQRKKTSLAEKQSRKRGIS